MNIPYVQGDRRPLLRVRLQSGPDAEPAPINVSAAVAVRAHVRFEGEFKESLIGTLVTGHVESVDRRTGAWTVITTAPYDVPGAGGIVVFYPSATTFDTAGAYQVEYEVDWGSGVKQTTFKVDSVNVREQFA